MATTTTHPMAPTFAILHVVDVADAHVKALEYLRQKPEPTYYESFNLGTGLGASVLELITTFERANGVKLNYEIGPRRPGDVIKVWANPAKIMGKMGWKPRFSLEEGLKHAWAWEQKMSGN